MTNKQSIQFIFALKLKKRRQEKGLSFAQLAKQTGLSISYLNEIEKGKKYPKADKIILLANALNISYDWLVSLKVDPPYTQMVALIRSNILDTLPLNLLGIPPITLLELAIKSPDQFNIFVHLMANYARDNNLSVQKIHELILRVYQEIQENYLEEVERKAKHFLIQHGFSAHEPLSFDVMVRMLNIHFSCLVNQSKITKNIDLQTLYAVYLGGKNAQILLNPNIPSAQQCVELSRELGYHYLQLEDRINTTPWFEIQSFEQLWNHHKASYFARAILIPEDDLKHDLTELLSHSSWHTASFLGLLEKYAVPAETLMKRIANILSKKLNISHFFYAHLHQERGKFKIQEELYISTPNSPYEVRHQEHYCRNWLGISLLEQYTVSQIEMPRSVICDVQVAKYADQKALYFCLTMAFQHPISQQNESITIGILLNTQSKKIIPFWDAISTQYVHTSCERCDLMHCKKRVENPTILYENDRINKLKSVLNNLQDNH